MTFELSDFTKAKLASVNLRAEKHGPHELVPAVDLTFVLDVPNTSLDLIDTDLLETLYRKANLNDKAQQDLEGVEPASEWPVLRLPKLGLPLKWELDLTGYTLTFERGLAGRSNLEFGDGKVNEFRINPKEGGTCEIKFRTQFNTGLDEKILGKVALLSGHDVSIQLRPPAVEGQGDLTGGDGGDNPFPVQGKDKPLTAQDVFVAGGSTNPGQDA